MGKDKKKADEERKKREEEAKKKREEDEKKRYINRGMMEFIGTLEKKLKS